MYDATYADDRLFLIVADASAGAASAAAAVADVGGRVADTVTLADAADRLRRQCRVDAVMMELEGCGEDAIAYALPSIAHLAADRHAGLCIAGGASEIDAAWAAAPELTARMLIDASITDRVVALAMLPRGGRLHDAARTDDERRRRINIEVSRFAETLLRLADDVPAGVAPLRDTNVGYRPEPTDAAAATPGPVDAALVRNLIRARRMRAAHFPGDLFADPAWDMLLDLFAAELEDRRVSVSSLCIAAAVPGTTALRWIGTMVEAQLFTREADRSDRRRAHVALTDTARRGMFAYFDAVRRAGLSPA